MPARGFSLEEMAAEIGLPVRTIRYYIAQELLPGSLTRGRGAVYGEEHLLRLGWIQLQVQKKHPLKDIRQKLRRLSLRQIRAQLQEAQRAPVEPANELSPRAFVEKMLERSRLEASRSGPDAGPSEGTHWLHVELGDGLQLQVRADVEATHRRLIGQIMRLAGEAER